MAKRVRGSSTRPGQRRPLQRTAGRPAPAAPTTPTTPRPTGLTPEEEARAAELEAGIIAEERAAESSRRRTTERGRAAESGADLETRTRATSGLAVKAADEYAYVGRDVRRITLIGGSLIILLLVLWAISNVAGSGAI